MFDDSNGHLESFIQGILTGIVNAVPLLAQRAHDEARLQAVGFEEARARERAFADALDRVTFDAAGMSVPLDIVSTFGRSDPEALLGKPEILVNGASPPVGSVVLRVPLNYKLLGETIRKEVAQSGHVGLLQRIPPAVARARPKGPALSALRHLLAAMGVPDDLVTRWLKARKDADRMTRFCEVLAAALGQPVALEPSDPGSPPPQPSEPVAYVTHRGARGRAYEVLLPGVDPSDVMGPVFVKDAETGEPVGSFAAVSWFVAPGESWRAQGRGRPRGLRPSDRAVGNAILLYEGMGSYVYIGADIRRFRTDDPIVEFRSPIGHSRLPGGAVGEPRGYAIGLTHQLLFNVEAAGDRYALWRVPLTAGDPYAAPDVAGVRVPVEIVSGPR